MRTPADYPKTLFFLQGMDTTLYTVAAIVIYVYGGPDVLSPALSSAGPLMSKVAYGVAIPTVSYRSHILLVLNRRLTDPCRSCFLA